MRPNASTTARALHDLGLATSFGGSVFGRMAMTPAVDHITNFGLRDEVVHSAWRRFSLLNLVSHGIFAVSWIAGRTRPNYRLLRSRDRALVRAKDALMAGAVATGVLSMVAGEIGLRSAGREELPPYTPEGEITTEVPRRANTAERISSVAGLLNLASLAGIVGITAVLAMRPDRSMRWPLMSRLLP